MRNLQPYTPDSTSTASLVHERWSPSVFSTSGLSYEKVYIEQKKAGTNEQLRQLEQKLESLKNWPKNWDGYGSARPKKKSISHALKFLRDVFLIAHKNNCNLQLPLISADEEGNVSCEWWVDDRKLTIVIADGTSDYTMINQIDSCPIIKMGEIIHVNKSVELLEWLVSGAGA